MPLPNLIIIGAHKCGTTSMHGYLDQHPDISMSRIKELNFFTEPSNWDRGVDWYCSQFEENRIVGEASVMYTRRPRGGDVPRKIYEALPEAQLIYMVRDPIERIRSHYVQFVDAIYETRSFDEIVRTLERDTEYLDTSRYYYQISRYLEYFPRNQILIVSLEGLMSRPEETMARVFRFLGVADHPVDFSDLRNPSSRKRRPRNLVHKVMPVWLKEQLHWPTWLPGKAVVALRSLIRATGTPLERPRLTAEQEGWLIECLRDDVARFREIAGCELTGWRSYGEPSEPAPAWRPHRRPARPLETGEKLP